MKTNNKSKKSNWRFCHFKILAASILLLTIILMSAGCVDETSTVNSKPCEIPQTMASASLDLITDLKNIGTAISMDLYDLADKVGDAESREEAKEIMLDYYGKNIWIEKLIYYDLADGDRIRVPELAEDMYITDYLPVPSQKDLEAAGGILHVDCVYIPGDGYVNANYAAVYDDSGKYKGFLIIIYDSYVMLNLHPIMTGVVKEYANYACFILNKNNEIIFSTNPEYIGTTVPENSKIYTGQSLIIDNKDSKYGAYQYTSTAFYNYLKSENTVKITAWEDFTHYKSTYTLYITKEVNEDKIKYDNVYSVDPGKIRDEIVRAYVYASSNSKENTLRLINDGEFSYSVAAMDYEGNVIASATKELIGLNYMNNRGTYGTSYTESIIYTAQQGGGYVYYTYPVEPSISPVGSELSFVYVLPINNEWFIFGNFAGNTDVLPTDLTLRTDVTSVSREIVGEAFEYDVYYVIDKINNNPNCDGSSFVSGLNNKVSNVGVIDVNGYVYASAYRPDFVGTVQTGYTDVYGGSTIRKMIMLAKAGGGLMCHINDNPDKEGYIDLWLYSIEPIDNYYFVQSGVIIGTYEDYLGEYLDSLYG